MRQSLTVLPLLAVASVLFSPAARAMNQPGDRGFATNIGFADPRSDSTYRSDQALNISYEYQKSGYAAYRATAGFLTVEGRAPISPAAGTRDADALYFTGNVVWTPRFAALRPFVTAGVGVYSFRVTDNVDSSHALELGANWGFGMDIQLLRHFALRGEYLFHYTTGTVSNPLETFTLGGDFLF
jgi:outer membrane protein with beta-barrel domain